MKKQFWVMISIFEFLLKVEGTLSAKLYLTPSIKSFKKFKFKDDSIQSLSIYSRQLYWVLKTQYIQIEEYPKFSMIDHFWPMKPFICLCFLAFIVAFHTCQDVLLPAILCATHVATTAVHGWLLIGRQRKAGRGKSSRGNLV